MAPDTDIELTPKAQRILEFASKLFYERFGSKDGLVLTYLRDRDRRWRGRRDAAVEAAGSGCAERLRAAFDASATWSDTDGGKGCGSINAHAEFSDETHPVAVLIAEQKRETLDLFRAILAGGGITDEGVVEAVMALHEGALVAHGIGIGADPWGSARDAALRLAGVG